MPARRKNPRLLQWLFLNLKIGALSFGSGGRVLLYQDTVVEDLKWLTKDEFREAFTITQVLPGPNLGNLALYLGYRIAGVLGAVLGLLCLAMPGTALLLVAYLALRLTSPGWEAFFRGVSVGSLVLFFLLIENSAQGLQLSHAKNHRAGRKKMTARWALALFTAGLCLANLPVQVVLVVAGLSGVILEFTL
jgi:chromate transporter